MRSYPILKRLTQYFATLNNKDLLSVRGTCKSFHRLANKLLNVRNKPIIITNGTISGTADQQISSTNEENDTNDFLMLQRWHPEVALIFDDCNNPTPRQYMPFDCLYFQIVPYDDRFDILLNFPTGGMLANNHPRSGVVFPKMYDAPVKFIFRDDINHLPISSFYNDYSSAIGIFLQMINRTQDW
uniref:F-box domain-containing protein n=1 Tax=Onchocerca volvulus TaxID=6282 RepID=A0A8R1Y1W0_ONCVO